MPTITVAKKIPGCFYKVLINKVFKQLTQFACGVLFSLFPGEA